MTTFDEICRHLREELRFFRYLGEDDLDELKVFLDCRWAKAGEVLWREGDADSFIVFVATGRVEEKKQTEFEDKQVVVGVYGPGSVVGEFGILDGRSRPFTTVALEDSGLLMLSRENFERLTALNPPLGVKLLKGILFATTTRLKKAFDRLASIF